MTELERYIKENINQYQISSGGYANLENYDPQDELEILAKDEDFMDEVLAHHVKDLATLQLDLVKSRDDWKSTVRALGAIRSGMISYFKYVMDNLGHDELLLAWQDDYADEYARSAAIDGQIESRMMEESWAD